MMSKVNKSVEKADLIPQAIYEKNRKEIRKHTFSFIIIGPL